MDTIQEDLQKELNGIENKIQVIRSAKLYNLNDTYITNGLNPSHEPVCQFFGASTYRNNDLFAKLFENSAKLFTIVETLVSDDIEKVYDPEFYNEMVTIINNILKD